MRCWLGHYGTCRSLPLTVYFGHNYMDRTVDHTAILWPPVGVTCITAAGTQAADGEKVSYQTQSGNRLWNVIRFKELLWVDVNKSFQNHIFPWKILNKSFINDLFKHSSSTTQFCSYAKMYNFISSLRII